MSALTEHRQKLDVGGVVELFKLDLVPIGVAQEYYFCRDYGVSFGGQAYAQVPVEMTDIERNVTGEMSAPKISLPNVDKFASSLVIEHEDLVGAEVTRTITYEKFLDGQPGADPDAIRSLDLFVIEQKVGLNKVFAQWEMRVLADTGDRYLPGRTAMKEICPFTYRLWNKETGQFMYAKRLACPYTHPTIFRTKDNQPTTDPALDVCDHRVGGGCLAREPGWANGILLFGGFPGMSRYRA